MAFWTSAVERVFPGARQVTEDYDQRAIRFRLGAAFIFVPTELAAKLTVFGADVQMSVASARNGWDEAELDVQLNHVAWPASPR
jgi:hypothetical protein